MPGLVITGPWPLSPELTDMCPACQSPRLWYCPTDRVYRCHECLGNFGHRVPAGWRHNLRYGEWQHWSGILGMWVPAESPYMRESKVDIENDDAVADRDTRCRSGGECHDARTRD